MPNCSLYSATDPSILANSSLYIAQQLLLYLLVLHSACLTALTFENFCQEQVQRNVGAAKLTDELGHTYIHTAGQLRGTRHF
jgi:hypothetical protein